MGHSVVDHGIFRFSARRSVQEIFTIKVENPEIVHVLAPTFFGGACPPNFWTCIMRRTHDNHDDDDDVAKFHGDRSRTSENAWENK